MNMDEASLPLGLISHFQTRNWSLSRHWYHVILCTYWASLFKNISWSYQSKTRRPIGGLFSSCNRGFKQRLDRPPHPNIEDVNSLEHESQRPIQVG